MLNELMTIAPWFAAAIIFASGAVTMAICIAIAIVIDERVSARRSEEVLHRLRELHPPVNYARGGRE